MAEEVPAPEPVVAVSEAPAVVEEQEEETAVEEAASEEELEEEKPKSLSDILMKSRWVPKQ